MPGTKQAGGQKLISFEEVQKHNKQSDCWVVIDVGFSLCRRIDANHQGNVYDVTDFIENHPGGAGIIVQNAGKDAT
jgi:L-lactate dehydrogenase (cytochrome)